MSWYERGFASRWRALSFAAAGAVAVAGCGFHPLYAERSALGYDPTLAAIVVQPVPDRAGQILVQSVRQELNPRGVRLKPRYVLNIGMSMVRSDLGISRNNTSTRGELIMNASLTLSDANTHATVYRTGLRSITSFNEPNDAYAATVAEDHARDLAAVSLGREIAERVTLYLHSQQAQAGP